MKNKTILVLSKKGIISIVFFCLVIPFIYSQEVPFDQLNLTGSALYAATRIKERFPNVIFTGGTRTLDSQARAVAQNIFRSQNSGWVGATYRDSPFIRRLNQEIINNWNSIKGSESLILQTVNRIFQNDNAGARTMSKHLSGYAFDLRVNCVNYSELNSFVRTLPGFHQFLTQEGGLAVWHIEFNEAPTPADTAVFTPLSSDYGWTTNRANDHWTAEFNQGRIEVFALWNTKDLMVYVKNNLPYKIMVKVKVQISTGQTGYSPVIVVDPNIVEDPIMESSFYTVFPNLHGNFRFRDGTIIFERYDSGKYRRFSEQTW